MTASWLAIVRDVRHLTCDVRAACPPPPQLGGRGVSCVQARPQNSDRNCEAQVLVKESRLMDYSPKQLSNETFGLNKNRKIRTKSKQMSSEAPSSVKVVKITEHSRNGPVRTEGFQGHDYSYTFNKNYIHRAVLGIRHFGASD